MNYLKLNLSEDKNNDTPELRLWKAVVNKGIHDALWKIQRTKYTVYNKGERYNIETKNGMWRYTDAVKWINSDSTKEGSFLSLCQITNHTVSVIRKVVNLDVEEFKQILKKIKKERKYSYGIKTNIFED